MSHAATNWAIEASRGIGLSPAQKLVLWHLADRVNRDTRRCDPDQETLAEDCEISRSSLNNQLKALEEKGLIKRFQRKKSGTKRQESTFYILGCDFDLAPHIEEAVSNNCTWDSVSKLVKSRVQKSAEPCPNSGKSRVQNLDSNPVRGTSKNQWCPKSRLNFRQRRRFSLISAEAMEEASKRYEGFDVSEVASRYAEWAERKNADPIDTGSHFLSFFATFAKENPLPKGGHAA